VNSDGSWTNDEVRKVLRGTAKDLGKEEGMDNTFGYGLLSLHFPAGQQKPALLVVVVVAVDRSSYNIISGVASTITLSFFTSARLRGRRRCTLSDGSRRWHTWCPDVILLYLVMVLPLAVPFFPDVLDNNGVAHLCAHEISASKDLFDYACPFEPASGAYDPASLFAGYAAQLD
jgi:hypothetical protein